MSDALKRVETFLHWMPDDKLLACFGETVLHAKDIRAIIEECKKLRKENDALLCKVADQAGEIERLRADCERFRSEADIANAQVKAWNEAVYVEGIPLRAIPDTEYGDKVPPICHVEPKKVVDLLDEIDGLRSIVSDMVDACDSDNIESNLICGYDDGVPATRWHEEWAHYAKKALKGGE